MKTKTDLHDFIGEQFLHVCNVYGINQFKIDNGNYIAPHPIIQGHSQHVQEYKGKFTAQVTNKETPGLELLIFEDGEIEVRDIYPEQDKTRILYEGKDLIYALEIVTGIREVKKAIKVYT